MFSGYMRPEAGQINPLPEKTMTVAEYIQHLKNSPEFMKNVTSWRVLPERSAKYGSFPASLEPDAVYGGCVFPERNPGAVLGRT